MAALDGEPVTAVTPQACPTCGVATVELVVQEDPGLAARIAAILLPQVRQEINRQTARIVRAISTEGNKVIMTINDDIDAAMAPVLAAVEAVDTDVARELADFAAQVAPKLTADELANFAAITQKLTDLDTSVNAADPPPAPTV